MKQIKTYLEFKNSINESTDYSKFEDNANLNKEFEKLYDEMVPLQGSCKTLNGELILAASRLNYEFFNNGNCNACEVTYKTEQETCNSCGGDGYYIDDDTGESEDCYGCNSSGYVEEEVEDEILVNQFYEKFLKLIKKSIKNSKEICDKIENIITNNLYASENQFSNTNKKCYYNLIDCVTKYVIDNKDNDKEIPDWYEKH